MTNKVVLNRRSREPKNYVISMRLSDLIWLGVGAALALSIFFLFGLLIGRGYVAAAPEDAAPVVVLQPAQAGLAGQDGQTGQTGQIGSAAGGDAAVQEPPAAPAPVVIQPEDLNYPDKLGKAQPAVSAEAQAEAAAPANAAGTPAKTAKAEASKTLAAETAAKEANAPEEGAAFDMAPPEPGEKVYHYVYQVASFKDAGPAELLRKKLTAKGLPAEVSKATIKGRLWHRVVVPFTGTPSQTDPLRDSIESITGQKPIRASKELAN